MAETWLTGILTKRPLDALGILTDLLAAGLRRGECNSNDIRRTDFAQPAIIGAVFKTLRKFGFVSSGRVTKSTGKKRHKGMILIWELREPSKARAALQPMREMLCKAAAESAATKQTQQLLGV